MTDEREQFRGFGSFAGDEEVNLDRASGGDFPSVVGLYGALAAQFEKLESVKTHEIIITPAERGCAQRLKWIRMCRSIKVLRRAEEPATQEEIAAAALQFVRKVSGYRKPSRANEGAFDAAVGEIAGSVEKLLSAIDQNVRK